MASTVPPSASTAASWSVYERRGVGIRTFMTTWTGALTSRGGRPLLDRVDLREVAHDRRPRPALVDAGPHLTAGGAEVHAHGVAGVDRHRLALHGPPRLVGHALGLAG